MHRLYPTLRPILAGLALLAVSAAPAAADTTVAQFDRMPKAEQAHLLGSLLQSLAEDLERHKRVQEAECLVRLYTNPDTDARVIQSPGMEDFFASLANALETGPDYFTIEDIIARQMVQNCGKPPSSQ
jgi:hypothetical protein